MKRCAAGVVASAIAGLLCSSATFAGKEQPAAPAPSAIEVGDTPAGNYLSAVVAGADRDTEAAAMFFKEALRVDPRNPELIERAFVAALANGNMHDAVHLAERLVLRDPGNSVANLTLGVHAIKNRQWVNARSHLLRGGVRTQDVTATLLAAWSFAGAGDERHALEMVAKLDRDGFKVFRDYHSALIADLLGDANEAAKRFKAVFASEKNTLRLVDAYARFEDRHGNAAEAKRAYADFNKILPDHPIVTAAMADLAAGKTLPPLVKSAEAGAAEVLYGLGAAGGGHEGDELASMIYLRLALYLSPDNGLATVTLGDLYEKVKQTERAVDVYRTVGKDSPLYTNTQIQIGLTLDAMGKPDEAVSQLQGVVAANANNPEAITALGNVYSNEKKYEQADELFTKAIGLIGKPQTGNWVLFYRRGIALERQKKWPAAEADFKEALTLNPDQPLVLNYLGYSWVDQGMNLDQGFNMLRRAVELRPSDGYVVDSLGWAHYRLGQYPDAVKDLERAVDLKPSDPVINDHLGDAYWQIGRRLEAKFQWNHARDLKPEANDLKRILKKIDLGLTDSKPASANVPAKKIGG